MDSKKLKIWFRAIRPFSLTGSIIPVILGGILAIEKNKFSFIYLILSIIAIVSLQIAVNLISDHDDYVNKVDTVGSYGSSGVILEGLLSEKEVLKGGVVFLFIGSAIGLLLVYLRGIELLILEIVGVILCYSYTGRPLSFKYRGLGTVVVFIVFGPLMTMGSYFTQVQDISLNSFLVSLPIGLLTTAIVHANEIRDISNDKKAGIKTLSMIVGKNSARTIYYMLIIFSYISSLVIVVFGKVPVLTLISLITIPIAIKNLKKLRNLKDSVKDVLVLDIETAQLQGKFGILYILAIIITFAIR